MCHKIKLAEVDVAADVFIELDKIAIIFEIFEIAFGEAIKVVFFVTCALGYFEDIGVNVGCEDLKSQS